LQSLLEDGIYEEVVADQCAFGLEDEEGAPNMKPTRFLVNKGSEMKYCLERRCNWQHQHALTVGRTRTYWPRDLAAAIVSEATHNLANRETDRLYKAAATRNLTVIKEAVAKFLLIRKDLVDPVAVNNGIVPVRKDMARRQILVWNKSGILAGYMDTFDWHEDFYTTKLDSALYEDDIVMTVFAKKPAVLESYSAIRSWSIAGSRIYAGEEEEAAEGPGRKVRRRLRTKVSRPPEFGDDRGGDQAHHEA
jgi:hypothetical protein